MAQQSTTGGILEGILEGVLMGQQRKHAEQIAQRQAATQLQARLAQDQSLFDQNLQQKVKERSVLDPILQKAEEEKYQRGIRRKETEQDRVFKSLVGAKDPVSGLWTGGQLSAQANEDPEFASTVYAAQRGIKIAERKNKELHQALSSGDFRKAEKSAKNDKELDTVKKSAQLHYVLQQMEKGQPPTLSRTPVPKLQKAAKPPGPTKKDLSTLRLRLTEAGKKVSQYDRQLYSMNTDDPRRGQVERNRADALLKQEALQASLEDGEASPAPGKEKVSIGGKDIDPSTLSPAVLALIDAIEKAKGKGK